MERDELDENKLFLNNKEVPTPLQIAKLLFNEEDIDLLGNEMGINESYENLDEEIRDIDFSSLGEADEVETIQGTEWAISKLTWNQGQRTICKINLIKLDNITDNITDIEHIDVTINPHLTFDQRLDKAIEEENFEEAARLRDWNAGFIDLLKDLQPKITEAIKLEDVGTLEKCQKLISDYKSKL